MLNQLILHLKIIFKLFELLNQVDILLYECVLIFARLYFCVNSVLTVEEI